MKIGICTMEKFDNRKEGSVGSSRIRGQWLINYWSEAEHYVMGREYDVIIFQKVYWDMMLDNFKGIKIFDICDPDWLEGKPVMQFIQKCDTCVTSTEKLSAYIRKFVTIPVVCIPDRIDFSTIKEQKTDHPDELKHLVWWGYSNNFKYVRNTLEYLSTHGYELTIISEQTIQTPAGYGAMRIHNVPYEVGAVDRTIIKYDAALLPDPSVYDERGKYKSNNKTTHAWALKMPVIQFPEDFKRLKTKEARIAEVENNYKIVTKDYDVNRSVDDMKAVISNIKK